MEGSRFAALHLLASILCLLSFADPLLGAPKQVLRAPGYTAADVACPFDDLAGLGGDPFAEFARAADHLLSAQNALP